VPNDPSTLPHAPENVQLPQVTSCLSKTIIPSAVGDPLKPGSAKASWVRTSFFFLVQWIIAKLSCLCHPSNHPMGSSAPWRSELIISPCVPVHWYLSAGYGPAHQRLRPPWAHQSSGSWQCQSYFIIKFVKYMHEIPSTSSKSSKTLHISTIQS
jgi:hypothetical protein